MRVTQLTMCQSHMNPLESRGNYSSTSNNNKLGTLAFDGWAVTFGTARRDLCGLVPSSLYQM